MRPKVVMNFSMSFQPYQGRYLRVYNQARTLIQDGYDVILLAWDREGKSPLEEVREGIRIYRIPIRAEVMRGPFRNALNVLRFNWEVLKYLRKAEFDVAHCFNLDAIGAALLGAKLRAKRSVLDLCEPEYYACWDRRFAPLLKIVNFIEAGLARRYDHVLVHNEFQVRKFRDKGIKHVTQVGSYPNLYLASKEAMKARRRRDDVVVIGRIGTIYENNGLEELLEAFKLLIEKQRCAENPINYRLFLAGRVFDSYKSIFSKLIKPLAGEIDLNAAFDSKEMHKLYQQVDISVIFVRKTRWFRNITPTKLFDSLSNGVPVVANDIGEVKQIVTEGDCGVIVDEKDTQSVVEGLERLGTNKKLRLAMGERARRVSRKKYNWEAQRERFCSVYSSLMTSNHDETCTT